MFICTFLSACKLLPFEEIFALKVEKNVSVIMWVFLYSWWTYFKYLLIIFISLSVSSCIFFCWDALPNFLDKKVVAFEFFFFFMQNNLALFLILICFSLHVFTLFYVFLPLASTSQSKSLSSVRKLLRF